MAIVVASQPDFLAFAGNPINFTLSRAASSAASGYFTLDFTGGFPAVGETLTLSWLNESLTFTASASASLAADELPAATHATPTAALVKTQLESNWQIHRHFVVTEASDVVTLTARTKSDETLDIDTNFANLTSSATDGGRADTLEIVAAVEEYDGTTWQETGYEKAHTLNDIGQATFNVAQAFQLGYDIPVNLTSYAAITAINACQLFRLRYTDRVNTVLGAIERTASKLALAGARPADQINDLIYIRHFLTTSPRYLKASTTQPLYLAFVASDTLTTAELRVTVYEFDGTTHTLTYAIGALSIGQMVYLPCGYVQLDLLNDANEPFYKWDCLVRYGNAYGTMDTETITFEADFAEYDNEAVFLFQNSRGGIDSIRFTGATDSMTAVTRQSAQYTDSNDVQHTQHYDHQLQYNYKQYSGYMSNAYNIDYLDELLLSQKVWWYKDGDLHDVNIDTTTFEKYSSDDVVYALEFEFSSSYSEPAPRHSFMPTMAGDDIPTEE